MSADGSSVERLSEVGAATPIWAPDGKRILYVLHTADETAFLVVSASGKALMKVPVPSPITAVGGVSWFPGGTGIAFAGKTDGAVASYDIYRMRLGAEEPAIRLIVEDGIQPAWSPDGRLLVFTTNRDGNLELYLADGDGQNFRNLTRNEGFDAHPSWFPDGSRIAFESDRFGNLQICIVDLTSGEVVQVTDHSIGQSRQPALSPDGREIVFASNRDGKSSIYRMAADGTDPIDLGVR